MKTFQKVLRAMVLTLMIMLAASGAGLVGAFLSNTRERYGDKEIRIEQVDKKKNEDETKGDRE